jgi:hypothetical protein
MIVPYHIMHDVYCCGTSSSYTPDTLCTSKCGQVEEYFSQLRCHGAASFSAIPEVQASTVQRSARGGAHHWLCGETARCTLPRADLGADGHRLLGLEDGQEACLVYCHGGMSLHSYTLSSLINTQLMCYCFLCLLSVVVA